MCVCVCVCVCGMAGGSSCWSSLVTELTFPFEDLVIVQPRHVHRIGCWTAADTFGAVAASEHMGRTPHVSALRRRCMQMQKANSKARVYIPEIATFAFTFCFLFEVFACERWVGLDHGIAISVADASFLQVAPADSRNSCEGGIVPAK